jgi:2-deoxy-D-gluconate 3-dehydrogenase
LAVEWAKFGITVNSVAPTFIETNMTRERLKDPEFLNFVLGKIPANRIADVNDVAAAVIFLASKESGMVNGHTLSVDGGWTVW